MRVFMPAFPTAILRQRNLKCQCMLTETICFCSSVPQPCHRERNTPQSWPIVRSPGTNLPAALPMINTRRSRWRATLVSQATVGQSKVIIRGPSDTHGPFPIGLCSQPHFRRHLLQLPLRPQLCLRAQLQWCRLRHHHPWASAAHPPPCSDGAGTAVCAHAGDDTAQHQPTLQKRQPRHGSAGGAQWLTLVMQMMIRSTRLLRSPLQVQRLQAARRACASLTLTARSRGSKATTRAAPATGSPRCMMMDTVEDLRHCLRWLTRAYQQHSATTATSELHRQVLVVVRVLRGTTTYSIMS
mmetsp:Transcript_77353/g.195344  ORF Transcript_77353/g.195344 Transcript_77353/m.195344 type:complete len:298 (+) Transcript_77353:273-1166(+)